mgnify:CR=1 FL=1
MGRQLWPHPLCTPHWPRTYGTDAPTIWQAFLCFGAQTSALGQAKFLTDRLCGQPHANHTRMSQTCTAGWSMRAAQQTSKFLQVPHMHRCARFLSTGSPEQHANDHCAPQLSHAEEQAEGPVPRNLQQSMQTCDISRAHMWQVPTRFQIQPSKIVVVALKAESCITPQFGHLEYRTEHI